MLPKARIDAPGAFQHIIARGIGRKKVSGDEVDRDFFVERFDIIIPDTKTQCLAWALTPNYFHLLLITCATSIATVMKRISTVYAMNYNRRHKRREHLFQNRYKSILCQEDIYLLGLVRYIHLIPLQTKLVNDIMVSGGFSYAGHGLLMGKKNAPWQKL